MPVWGYLKLIDQKLPKIIWAVKNVFLGCVSGVTSCHECIVVSPKLILGAINKHHCVSDYFSLKEGEDQKEISIEPALAFDEVEPLPEDCYTRPISLPEGESFFWFSRLCFIIFVSLALFEFWCRCSCVCLVTTLRQRLLQPDFQPAGASQLHPRHKHLLMKRSLRCRVGTTSGFSCPHIKGGYFCVNHIKIIFYLPFLPQKCEHNLSKPEFNPTSIKFKIQLVAVWVFVIRLCPKHVFTGWCWFHLINEK